MERRRGRPGGRSPEGIGGTSLTPGAGPDDGRGHRPLPRDLRLLIWETTAGCNLECMHCRRHEVSREMMRDDLSTAEGRALIDQVAEVGRPILVLAGGEPLVRPDLFDLARYAVGRSLTVSLATNGTLVDWPTAQAIQAAGIRRVSVSLDGASAETHDTFRRQLGSFHQALEGIAWLRRAGLEVQVNATIAAHNADELRAIYDLTCGVGAAALHAFMLAPVGCGLALADGQLLDPERYETVLGEFAYLSAQGKVQCKAVCAPHYARVIRQQAQAAGKRLDPRRPREETVPRGCSAGSAGCFVSHTGEVFPCGYLPVSAGRVREVPFPTIWRDSPLLATLRDPDRLEGKCGGCDFNRVCGGCRARAFAETGNYLGEESYCPFGPTPDCRDGSRS